MIVPWAARCGRPASEEIVGRCVYAAPQSMRRGPMQELLVVARDASSRGEAWREMIARLERWLGFDDAVLMPTPRRSGAVSYFGVSRDEAASMGRILFAGGEGSRGSARRTASMAWRARVLCLAIALWSGCGGNATAPSSTTPSSTTPSSTTPSSTTPSTEAPTAAAPTTEERCEELLQRYRTTLAGRTGRCSSDDGCMITGSWDPETLCGVAADLETARAVARIYDEGMAAGCGAPGYSCPARLARCVDGACDDPASD